MRLRDEIVSAMQFTLEVDGVEQQLSAAALQAYLHHPDREQRRRAVLSFEEGLERQRRPLVFIYNTLIQDKATDDRLRGYPAPESARHLRNELTPEIVETMSAATVEAYPLVARYYALKRRILGLDRLYAWDYAEPLPGASSDIPWDTARRIVVDAYTAFAPEIGAIVDRFFRAGWIDAAVRPGKRGGAFCAANTPTSHAYVLLNYTGKPRDVMTLAHELGHAVHDALSSAHSFLEFRPPLALRETASTFGEILVFDALRRRITEPAEKLALLAGKIEDLLAATFFQIALHRFEQRVHRMRREHGELDADAFGAVWQEERKALYGSSVELTEGSRMGWSWVRHFVHSPFHLYAYPFGLFLTLGLYRLYQADGAAFLPQYRQIFGAGGSVAPRALLAGAASTSRIRRSGSLASATSATSSPGEALQTQLDAR